MRKRKKEKGSEKKEERKGREEGRKEENLGQLIEKKRNEPAA